MAKLKPDPIAEADLIDFIDHDSDFGFEITVLNRLLAKGFECEHGGSYEDPFTNKPREFDLRATKRITRTVIRLAVECKNLRENFPLLVSCLPRRAEESFHEVIVSIDPKRCTLSEPANMHVPAFEARARNIRFAGAESIYKPAEMVGKSVAQVGRTGDNSITGGDSEVYSKWAQALSSAQALMERCYDDGENGPEKLYLSVVVPVLVRAMTKSCG